MSFTHGAVLAALNQSDDNMDLLLQLRRVGGVRSARSFLEVGMRRGGETERRLAIYIRAHLPCVRGEVAADEIDPMHGEALVRSFDRNERLRGRSEHVGHRKPRT